jgi:hypothetical protein
MTGAKVAAATAAGVLEGEAEGTASAEAASAPGILSKLKGGGGIMGAAMGAGLVLAVAAAAAEYGPEIGKAGDQMGRTLFGGIAGAFGNTEQQGILHDTVFDSLFDGVNSAIKGVMDTDIMRFNIWDHEHGLFYMPPSEAEKAGSAAADAHLQQGAAHAQSEHADEAAAAIANAIGVPAADATADQFNTELASALQDATVPDDYVQWFMANTNAALDSSGKLVLTPLDQQLATWSQQEGQLTGMGVNKGIADAMLNGGKPVSDALYAMMNGLTFNADVNGPLASLYEALDVPQKLAIQWASTGAFDLQLALGAVMDKVHAGELITDSVQQSVLKQAEGQGLIPPGAYQVWTTGMIGPFKIIGGKAGDATMDGLDTSLVAHSGDLKADADKLHQLLLNGLSGKPDEIKKVGGKVMADFQKGIDSEDADTKQAAVQVGLDALAGLSLAVQNGHGSAKSAQQIGELFSTLTAKGVDAKSIAVALAADGVAADAVAKLTGYYPTYDAIGQKWSVNVATGIDKKDGSIDTAATTATAPLRDTSLADQGDNIGDAWMDKLAAGIRGGKATLEYNINKATAAMRGFSPPKEGPLVDIDKWGYNVGVAWAGGYVKGVGTASGALSGFQPPMGLGQSYGVGTPAMAVSGAAGSFSLSVGDINVTVEGLASDNPGDVGAAVADQVRAVLDDVIAQAGVNPNLRWSTS